MNYIKSTLQVFIAVIIIFFWTGCENPLDLEPESFTTGDNYYQTPDHFESAINSAYSRLRAQAGISTQQFMALTEMRFDAVHNDPQKPQNIPPHMPIDQWHIEPSNEWIHNQWTSSYHTIAQTNIILERIEDVNFSDQNQKNQIIGQAKFIRALSYWFLVQFFGDVPIILDEIKTPEEAFTNIERRSTSEVYDLIVTDLQDAIDKLPAMWSTPGNATEGAAKFLLGRTYLLIEDYQSAVNQFEDLVSTYDYELLPDYRDIFNPSNTNNRESIFELQFGADVTDQPHMGVLNHLLPWFSRGEVVASSVGPISTSLVSFELVDQYEDDDLREEASILWYDLNENENETIPLLRKYIWPEHINSQGQQSGNDILFRYADALLSLSEAYWRLDNESEAIFYLDQVRERAGLSGIDLSNVHVNPLIIGTYLEDDPLGRAIFNERTVELAVEGHRMFDLIRFEVAYEMASAYVESLTNRYPTLQGTFDVVQPHEILLPIHPREISISGGLIAQNPGW